jgi:hypothetical protein
VAGSHLDIDARPAYRSIRFVAALAVVVALVWFVFLRDDGARDLGATLPADVPMSTVEPAQVAQTGPNKGHSQTFEVFAPKDPFKALVSDKDPEKGKGDVASGDGHQVVVDSVSPDAQVVVNVDGTDFRPSVGEVFADSFQLVSVEEKCTALLYGDEQFTLCEGQEVTK